jgi:hypothetical protein
LDVVVRLSAAIFKLLAGKDKTLLMLKMLEDDQTYLVEILGLELDLDFLLVNKLDGVSDELRVTLDNLLNLLLLKKLELILVHEHTQKRSTSDSLTLGIKSCMALR